MLNVKESISWVVFLEVGNVTPLAEANVYGDPIASKIVFHQAKNLLIFPLNVTNKAVLTPNVFDYIQANSKNPFHTIMKPMYDYYFSAYQNLIHLSKGHCFMMWLL